MSHDYTLLRTSRPIRTVDELSEDIVEDLGSTSTVRGVLSTALPGIQWSELDGMVWGVLNEQGQRIEIILGSISEPRVTSLRFCGSGRVDMSRNILRIAQKLNLIAIDMETGRLLDEGVDRP